MKTMSEVKKMAHAWHDVSDHAADGGKYGSLFCNCRRIAQRAYDLGWRNITVSADGQNE